jgi:hypothetical protein
VGFMGRRVERPPDGEARPQYCQSEPVAQREA